MHRRTFLLGTAALAASCSRLRNNTPSLGTLAYVDAGNLWLRSLPDGKPRPIASGHRIAWPRFSPSGRWLSFQDGSAGRLVSTAAGPAQGPHWNTGDVGECPLNWLGDRDELAVCLADPKSGNPGHTIEIYTAADNWRSPQRSVPFGLDANFSMAIAADKDLTRYAYSATLPTGHNPDGSGRFQSTLLSEFLPPPG